MTKSSFLGGALSFKGGKKKSKKKSKKSKTKHKLKGDGIVTEISKSSSPQHGINDPDGMIDEFPSSSDEVDDDDELTDAERKALKFKKRSQQRESEKIAKQSHRERVEDMNEKLGNMTELNDIPRVSAAGNG
jgi:protein FAM32A